MKCLIFILLGVMLVLFGCLDNGTTVSDTNATVNNGNNGGGSVVIVSNGSQQSNTSGKQNATVTTENKTNNTIGNDFSKIRGYTASPNDTLFIRAYNISIGGNQDPSRDENSRLTMVSKGDFDAAVIDVSANKKDSVVYTILANVDDLEVEMFPLVTTDNKETIRQIINATKPGYLILPNTPVAQDLGDFQSNNGPSVIFVKDRDTMTHAGIVFQFLNPPLGTTEDRLFDNPNNDAIAFMMKDRDFTAVFPNDIRGGGTIKISTKYGSALQADFVTTPNYGADVEADALSLFASKTKPALALVEGYKRGASTKTTDPYETAKSAFGGYKTGVTALWNCKYYMVSYNGVSYEGKCVAK
jgi:hypothetical protein